jgi:uridine kinase
MESLSPLYSSATEKRYYSPPWADLSIIGIAGSSGSGKTSVAMEIVKSLNLPWVVILDMVLRTRSNIISIDISHFRASS